MKKFKDGASVILLLLMLWTIFIMHKMWYIDNKISLNKIIIITSFVLFILIIVEHIMYIEQHEDIKNMEENFEQTIKFAESKFNPDNHAVRLVMRILQHPVFLIL